MANFHDMPGHLIRRLHQISLSVFAERTAAAGFDLTPVQYAALNAISIAPGMDQATLAGTIAYDRATIGGVVDRLVAKGLVARQTSKRDRRARELVITGDGADILSGVSPVVEALQTTILAGLNSQEQAQFTALLQKTTQAGNQLSRAPAREPDQLSQ
ncbi:MAG: MarR family winged helix-turn-helix transcriptional regulator [Rhizobiaceae bacterium]